MHTRRPWSFELTGSVYLFTDNNEFNIDKKREQDTLFALQGHLIYVSKGGWWASLGAASDRGGRSRVDGERKDDRKRDLLYGMSAGISLSRKSGIKIAYVGSRKGQRIGADSDNLVLAYSVRF